ncbi:MAG TPA: hypothetical protein VFV99_33595 [Kofleriaceae bacterium]|nr:hypothetical protein [Kofleriaceae bacterium]
MIRIGFRLWLVLALAACSVKELDYTGKSCPCPSGYVCNEPEQTCVRSLALDGGDPKDGDGSGSDATATDSCIPNARANLAYATGFSDFLNAWLPSAGSWSYQSGAELQQQSDVATLAWAYYMMNGGQSYRVVASMHMLDINGGSLGIGFHIGNTGNMYTCTFAPTSGDLSLILTQNLGDIVLQATTVPFGDPRQPFTMEIQTVGAAHSCCLRTVMGSLITATDSALMSGNPGVVTREAAGGFTTFAVYQ